MLDLSLSPADLDCEIAAYGPSLSLELLLECPSIRLSNWKLLLFARFPNDR